MLLKEPDTVPRHLLETVKFPMIRLIASHLLSPSDQGINEEIGELDFIPSLSQCDSFITVLTEMKNTMKAVHLQQIGVFRLKKLKAIKRIHKFQVIQHKIFQEKEWFLKEGTIHDEISMKHDNRVLAQLQSFLLKHSNGASFMKPYTVVDDITSLCCNRWVSLGLVNALVAIMNATESPSRGLILNGLGSCSPQQMVQWLKLPSKRIQLEHLLLFINVGLDSKTGKTFISDYSRKEYHWVFLDIDISRRKYLYRDSLGWPFPRDLQSKITPCKIDNLAELTEIYLLLPGARNPHIIKSAHVAGTTNERGQHACTKQYRKNFPLQRCQEICGPVALLTAAICILHPDLWRIMKESHDPIYHSIFWFRNPSNYADFIKKCLVKQKEITNLH